jgi:hypothetical protein
MDLASRIAYKQSVVVVCAQLYVREDLSSQSGLKNGQSQSFVLLAYQPVNAIVGFRHTGC